MNIFPRAQRFVHGVPCVQIAWSERPNNWLNFEARKPNRTAEQQIADVQKHFAWMKVNCGLRYDILVRVAPATVAPREDVFVIERSDNQGLRYLAWFGPHKWGWTNAAHLARRWVREDAVKFARRVRANWRCKVRVSEVQQ